VVAVEQPVAHRVCELLRKLREELEGKPGSEAALALLGEVEREAGCGGQQLQEVRLTPEEELKLREKGVVV
jgi:hypothetical protein